MHFLRSTILAVACLGLANAFAYPNANADAEADAEAEAFDLMARDAAADSDAWFRVELARRGLEISDLVPRDLDDDHVLMARGNIHNPGPKPDIPRPDSPTLGGNNRHHGRHALDQRYLQRRGNIHKPLPKPNVPRPDSPTLGW